MVIGQSGAAPMLLDIAEPMPGDGESLLEVTAAPLNPADISVSSGRFFGGQPPLPYVPGVEATGLLRNGYETSGSCVFACLDGLGVTRNGTCAEMAIVRPARTIPLPPAIDPGLAAGVGTAGIAGWSPLVRRAPVRRGDVVLVLAATGTVGLVATQTARLLGAARVVAVGRQPRGLERAVSLGADAAVQLHGQEDLAAELLEACGTPPTYIFDPLWGTPIRAALEVAALHARVVQVGQAAGRDATLPSAPIRGKDLDIFGYTNLNLPFEHLAADYLALLDHVVAGRITVEREDIPLSAAVSAWSRQASGASRRLVIMPKARDAFDTDASRRAGREA